MSYKFQDEVWKVELPSAEKLVLLALAFRADESGECFPSLAGLSRLTGLDVKTVRKHVRALATKGAVRVVERSGRVPLYTVTPTNIGTPTKSGTPTKNDPSQNWEDTPTKNGRTPLPNLVAEQVKEQVKNTSIDTADVFAPLSEQIEAVSRPLNDNFLADPVHILTAPELIRLCAKNKVRIGSSSALYEICKKGVLTVLAAERLIADFKRTNHSVSYLIGMFRNFANEARPIVQEEQKPIDIEALFASDAERGTDYKIPIPF